MELVLPRALPSSAGTWPTLCPASSTAAFSWAGLRGEKELQKHKEALCQNGTPLKAPATVGTGWGGVAGGELEKASKSRSAGRAGLGWLSRSGDGQEAGLWIPKILLTELSGAGETAPGSVPPAVSAHFPRQPRGEASFLPASRFPSAASSHPRVAADHARGRALLPHDCACPRGVCGWHLGVPSLASSMAPRRLGRAHTQGRAAAPPATDSPAPHYLEKSPGFQFPGTPGRTRAPATSVQSTNI